MSDAWNQLPGTTGDVWDRMCGTTGDAWARLAGTTGDAWTRLIVACGGIIDVSSWPSRRRRYAMHRHVRR
jgi:hypothetical protein